MHSNDHDGWSSSRPKSEPAEPVDRSDRFGSGRGVRLVVPLNNVAPDERVLVGGKAANLARLMRARLPVPSGFCITTAAYDMFLANCPQREELWAMLARLRRVGIDGIAAVRKRAGAWLTDTEIPPAVEEAVLKAWRGQGADRPYAVRSSATSEDTAENSFAGQFASFLDIRTSEDLLKSVCRSWMSLFSERALAYQLTRGLAPERTAMAVVVQEMVPAVASGVLFTIDPVSGSAGRIVIEAGAGLGDRVVSGQVNPERVVLDKGRLGKIEHRMADEVRLLDDVQIRRLGRLARKAEILFGQPLDIEWAIVDGGVYLLQARAVTVKPPTKTWEERQVWSNLNTGEVMPDPLTPMTWSMILTLLSPIFRSFFRLHGANPDKAPIVGRVAGRIYFNVNTGLAALKPFAFVVARIPNLAQAVGGAQIQFFEDGSLDLPPEDLPDLGFRWHKYLLSWPRNLYEILAHSPRRGDAWTAALQLRRDDLAGVDLENLPADRLEALLARAIGEGFEGWDLLYLVTQAAALLPFQKACRDWLNDPHLTLAYQLFSALGGLPETEAGLALWRLALRAHDNPSVGKALLTDEEWPSVRAHLEQSAAGREFLAAWDRFMSEHGHHCRGELELSNRRWAEQPDYILDLVRGYARAVGQTDPLANQRRLAQAREELTRQCLQRLKNPVKRWIFWRSLQRARRLAINREVWKSQAVRHLTGVRRILLALGARLAQEDVLEHPDDIFFLEVSEIEPAVGRCAGFDVRAAIRRRREEYDYHRTLKPPPVVIGRFDSTTPVPSPSDPEADILRGIPVFPGIVTGPARVIERTEDHEQVLPGEILIAPFTDPAWTPYFLPAAGVVMDQGGILSHGSLVAREYGLPAVTNVGSATRLIRTGDLVQVDGGRGYVKIVARASRPRSPAPQKGD